jgi:Uma2 family endonuclease
MTVAVEYDEPRDPAEVLLEGFHALDTPEGFRAELIEGEIIVTPPPVGTHERNISRVVRQVMRCSAADMDFSGNKGLLVPRGGLCPKNHLVPDGVFVPADAFDDEPSWMPVDNVALVLEVTSSAPDRDRRAKRYCYARAGVPLYLLIDRSEYTTTLFSGPIGSGDLIDYHQDVRVPFGKSIDLPEPFSFSLDTGEFR